MNQRTTMRRLAALILGALVCLLQACASQPAAPTTTPLLRLSDGDGGNPAYAYQLGRHYEQQGDWQQADAAYRRSLALDPGQLDARNAQAVLLARQGRLKEAAALLRQLVTAYPDQAQPLGNLGYVLLLQGQAPAAIDALRAALALAPTYRQALANLAQAQASAGAQPAARTPPEQTLATSTSAPANGPPTAAARLELVRLSAYEFRLQARVSTPTVAGTIAAEGSGSGSGTEIGGIQIVNGNGVAGAADRARRLLRRQGITVAGLVNQRGHHQRRTVIEYLPGQRGGAEVLRLALGGRALLAPAHVLPAGMNLRLVLGRDHAGADNLSITQRLASTSPAVPLFNQE